MRRASVLADTTHQLNDSPVESPEETQTDISPQDLAAWALKGRNGLPRVFVLTGFSVILLGLDWVRLAEGCGTCVHPLWWHFWGYGHLVLGIICFIVAGHTTKRKPHLFHSFGCRSTGLLWLLLRTTIALVRCYYWWAIAPNQWREGTTSLSSYMAEDTRMDEQTSSTYCLVQATMNQWIFSTCLYCMQQLVAYTCSPLGLIRTFVWVTRISWTLLALLPFVVGHSIFSTFAKVSFSGYCVFMIVAQGQAFWHTLRHSLDGTKNLIIRERNLSKHNKLLSFRNREFEEQVQEAEIITDRNMLVTNVACTHAPRFWLPTEQA